VDAPEPHNPLDKRNLGKSVADALLEQPIHPLPPPKFVGAGIYAIYYSGDNELYAPMSARNADGLWEVPIYVGKAVPKGARQGRVGLGDSPGTVMASRLAKHSRTIGETDLDLRHFACRYLVVDDIWIPLGESLLINKFQPLWNTSLDGFGNNDPGRGRYEQQRSPWDVLHPGRSWAEKCADNLRPRDEWASVVRERLAKYPEDEE
jgi:hypothetical protein